MRDNEDIRLDVVEKLARKKVGGNHKKTVDTVKNWFPSHEQGKAEEVIRDMVSDPSTPVESYGGSRDNIRLTGLDDAKEYIRENGGELPWGLRD